MSWIRYVFQRDGLKKLAFKMMSHSNNIKLNMVIIKRMMSNLKICL